MTKLSEMLKICEPRPRLMRTRAFVHAGAAADRGARKN